MRCPCKRRKTDFLCNEVYIGDAAFECDDECEQLKEQKRKVRAGACVRLVQAHARRSARYMPTHGFMQTIQLPAQNTLLHCLTNVVYYSSALCWSQKISPCVFSSQEKEEAERARREEEEKRQQAEYERFQRKMQGRRQRRRKPRAEEDEPSLRTKYAKYVIVPVLVALMALFVHYLVAVSRGG